MKACVLYPNRSCTECGECEDRCQLNPNKICDNCFKCLENDAEFAEIKISDILMETDEDAFYVSKEASVFGVLQDSDFLRYKASSPQNIMGKRKI